MYCIWGTLWKVGRTRSNKKRSAKIQYLARGPDYLFNGQKAVNSKLLSCTSVTWLLRNCTLLDNAHLYRRSQIWKSQNWRISRINGILAALVVGRVGEGCTVLYCKCTCTSLTQIVPLRLVPIVSSIMVTSNLLFCYLAIVWKIVTSGIEWAGYVWVDTCWWLENYWQVWDTL